MPSQLWPRIYNTFTYGDIMITLGTGKFTQKLEKSLGLVGEHAYAILDLKQAGDKRLLLVKNPWLEGSVWRGSSLDSDDAKSEDWTNDLRNSLPESDKLQSGTFWIDFDDVMLNFESLYLNWNPGLFSYRQDHHFSWDLSEGGIFPDS